MKHLAVVPKNGQRLQNRWMVNLYKNRLGLVREGFRVARGSSVSGSEPADLPRCFSPFCAAFSSSLATRERNGRRPQEPTQFSANLHEEEGSLRVTVTLFQTGLPPMKGRLKLGSITCFAKFKEKESTYDEWEYGPHESRVRHTVAMDDSSGPRMWSTGVLPLSSSL